MEYKSPAEKEEARATRLRDPAGVVARAIDPSPHVVGTAVDLIDSLYLTTARS